MALSLFTATAAPTSASSSVATQQHHHHNNFGDLQTFIDSYALQNPTSCTNASSKSSVTPNTCVTELIELDSNRTQNSTNTAADINSNSTNSTVDDQQLQQQQYPNAADSQTNQHLHRNLMNNLHQQITTEYGHIITYVDSPPNSEESWPEDHAKFSPGPQIINVQTIYSNGVNEARKRRMDWDALDISDSGNSNSTAHHHQHNQSNSDKGKYKREKLNNGRSTWSDDIGFDLNAEFNSNSYINNETFLPFSPGLTVLKQEPQSEQIKLQKNSSLNNLQQQQQQPSQQHILTKTDKINSLQQQLESSSTLSTIVTTIITTTTTTTTTTTSPIPKYNKNEQQQCPTHRVIIDHLTNQDKTNCNIENGRLANAGLSQQLLTVLNASKIEQNCSNNSSNQITKTTSSDKTDCNPHVANATAGGDDYKFQYILAAATSIATKNNEDTLTYLNQGQSYEIKLKKIGDLSFYRDKVLKSVIKICFHERRLQFMEREQMQQWQVSRPGERIIEVDVPLSYGLCHVNQPLSPNYLNTVEVLWDPMKEVGVYIKVNCISTEFTPKKHGGEKGVPFRLQIETYIENTNIGNAGGGGGEDGTGSKVMGSVVPKTPHSPTSSTSTLSMNAAQSPPSQISNLTSTQNILPPINLNTINIGLNKQPIHAAACQIKVFKLKGADRKHKQDREKIQKRPQSEQEKFQPSYECTILNDIAMDIVTPTAGCFSPEYIKMWANSPIHVPKYDSLGSFGGNTSTGSANSNSPVAINNVSSTNSNNFKIVDQNMSIAVSPMIPDMEDYNNINIMPESTPAQVTQWLTTHRLTAYLSTFAHFSGADIMRMSKEDLIQICGLADGIRMFNILRAKAITPRLTIYVSLDGTNYHALYLLSNTAKELLQKLLKLPGFYELFTNLITLPGGIKGTNNGIIDNNFVRYNVWGGAGDLGGNNMPSKYTESVSTMSCDMNSKSLIYMSGPSDIHVAITDEVLMNEINDGSLYGIDIQNGKVIMKLINKTDH